MRTIARFMDARNTAEGKFLSVLLSVLLVFSFLNVTMFTDYAGANPNEGEDVSLPAEEPGLTEPGAAAEEPEAEKASEEVTTPAPAEEKQEASVEEEPAATDVEVELQLVDATIVYDGADYGDGDKLVAPIGEDLKFSVNAAEGSKVEASATVDGQDVALAPEPDGTYVVKADKVTESLAVVAVVATLETEEPVPGDTPEPSEGPEADEKVDSRDSDNGKMMPTEVSKLIVPSRDLPSNSLGGTTVYSVSASGSTTLRIGGTVNLTGASFLYSRHYWSSSNPAVATVSSNNESAVVTGVSSGTAVITHTYGNAIWGWTEESISITVEEPEALSLAVSPDKGTVKVGNSISVTAIVEPADATVSWSSSDTSIATVDSSGIVRGMGVGFATITATTRNGLSAKSTIEVVRNTDLDKEQTVDFFFVYPGVGTPGSGENFSPGEWLFAGEGKANLPANPKDGEKVYTQLNITQEPTYYKNKTITVDGVTYKYDTKGTGENGTFSIVWDKAVYADGSTNGNKWDQETPGNTTGNRSEKVWHIDGHLVLNNNQKATVTFLVQQPGENTPQPVSAGSESWPTMVLKGTPISEIAQPSTHAVPLVKTVDNVRYYFDGWYDDPKWSTRADFTQGTLDENRSWYGRYLAEVVYTYTVDGNGRVSLASESVAPTASEGSLHGSEATAENGYRFVGWFQNGARVSQENRIVPTKIDGLYAGGDFVAKFEPRDDLKYQIQYFYDGVQDKNATVNMTGALNQTISTYPDKSVREGYPNAYVLEEDNAPLVITANEMTNVIRVYYVSTYSLRYDANDGTGAPDAETGFVSGDVAVLAKEPVPTRAADENGKIVFVGWTEDKDLAEYKVYSKADAATFDKSKLVGAVSFADKDITVYAVWSYDANGQGAMRCPTCWRTPTP